MLQNDNNNVNPLLVTHNFSPNSTDLFDVRRSVKETLTQFPSTIEITRFCGNISRDFFITAAWKKLWDKPVT
jgi:hypothetical protein